MQRLFSMLSQYVTLKSNAIPFVGTLKILLLIMLLSGIITPNAQAELNFDRIDQIKAAFIVNIVRFIAWPAEVHEQQNSQLLLCLYRANPISNAINIIDGKKVGSKFIDVAMVESLSESQSCNILLISNSEIDSFIDEVRPGLDRPVLTIADFTERESAHAFHQDVLIALVRNGSRISFQVNLKKSRQVGLWMSSKLLKLATIVGDES